ncbi:MAG: NapC/NirT family cytochrome c [Armatimonadetes bacterium]|nr:NapC/NirT family cytochrome c [Armatimonadota bacterium]
MKERIRLLVSFFGTLWRGESTGRSRWLPVVKVAIFLPLLFVATSAVFVVVSNQPRFCISCHYMKPFYEAWKTSKHSNVKCVDCHIPPGARNWLQHKGAAAVQVVKYLTRQYGVRPWTEVDDKSCLRSGCHETRLLAGKVDFNGVSFDHTPHLTSFRRVTRLRCTSCHAQIVQGTHIAVTTGSCFVCHFKNAAEEPEMADCQLCHKEVKPHAKTSNRSESWVKHEPEAAPKPLAYDHKLVQERKVDCQACHNNVVRGNGDVPRSRCVTCHSDADHLSRYDDTQFMHRNHVTEHKVDCLRCHIEIEHSLPDKAKTPELNCASCHPQQHGATRDLYRGEGGHGKTTVGNPMFKVGVPCEGCHRDHRKLPDGGTVTRSGAAGCMLCHGETYGKALARWQTDASAWTTWAVNAMDQTERELAGKPESPGLAVARKNVTLVRQGGFIHNPDYAVDLLRTAHTQADQALIAAGSPFRWPQEPPRAKELTAGQTCAQCHSDAVNRTGFAFGTVFDHKPHVAQARLACGECHAPSRRPEESGHGSLVIGSGACQTCHSQRMTNSPHPAGWRVLHSAQAKLSDASCATCHARSYCDSCHGTRIPHGPDWVQRHGSEGHRRQVCAKCHERSFCDACHGVTVPHTASFRAEHGAAARTQPSTCARCHSTADCRRCHEHSPPPNHREAGWKQVHGGVGQRDPGLCSLCHGKQACSNCHGLTMPHPEGWTLKGHGPVAKRGKSVCAKCHAARWCTQCHADGGGEKR